MAVGRFPSRTNLLRDWATGKLQNSQRAGGFMGTSRPWFLFLGPGRGLGRLGCALPPFFCGHRLSPSLATLAGKIGIATYFLAKHLDRIPAPGRQELAGDRRGTDYQHAHSASLRRGTSAPIEVLFHSSGTGPCHFAVRSLFAVTSLDAAVPGR